MHLKQYRAWHRVKAQEWSVGQARVVEPGSEDSAPGLLTLQPNNNNLALGTELPALFSVGPMKDRCEVENTGDGLALYFCPRSRGQQDGQRSVISEFVPAIKWVRCPPRVKGRPDRKALRAPRPQADGISVGARLLVTLALGVL